MQRPIAPRLLGAVSVLLAALPTAADTPAGGFLLTQLPYPGHAATATLSNGDVIAFDGLTVDHYAENGGFLQTLATLPGAVFPSFVRVDPTETFALIGESSNGDLFQVPLAGGGASFVANLAFNYDAAFLSPMEVIVSAATCGFNCGNDLWRVDLASGVPIEVADLQGASGPVAVDHAGDVLYGTNVVTAPPGTADVLRFPEQILTGVLPLVTEADATLVGFGFEGPFALAHDPLLQQTYLLDNDFATGLNRVYRLNGSAAASPVLVAGTPGFSMANLEFVPGDGVAAFAAYQPARGGVLRYNSLDNGFPATVFERKELTTLRPRATLYGPGVSGPGLFQVTVADGPPGGLFFLFYAPRATYDPIETAILLSGLLIPLFTGLDLSETSLLPSPGFLDGHGVGSKTLNNNGSLTGTLALQALVLGPLGFVAGTSTAALL